MNQKIINKRLKFDNAYLIYLLSKAVKRLEMPIDEIKKDGFRSLMKELRDGIKK